MFKDSAHKDHGFALLSALVGLAILLVLVSSMVAISQFGVARSRADLERSQADAFADAVLIRAMLALQDARQDERPRVDGVPTNLTVFGIPVRLIVEDEFGKIDLNAAPPLLLSRLFQTTGLSAVRSDALAAQVDAWRNNEQPSAAPSTLLAQPAKRRIFNLANELLLVDRIDQHMFVEIEPALTVYSGQDHVDQAVAPERALMASLAISADQARLMIEQRSAGDSSGALSVVRNGKVLPGIDQRGWPYHIRAAFVVGSQGYCLDAIIRPTGIAGRGYVVIRWNFAPGVL